MSRSVLVIEDCPEEQQNLYDALKEYGCEVSTISDPNQALASVGQWAQQFNLVIIQEAMCGRCGLEILRRLRSERSDLPVVVVSRDSDWNGYARALSDGALDYFSTPVDRRKLLHAVESALAATG